MPTARELLEQADALMRRNRSAVADDIPVLTEAVSPQAPLRVPLRPSPESPPLPMEDAEEAAEAPDVIPTLTEKVPPTEPEGEGAVLAEGEPSDWLEFEEGEPSITGKAPNSVMSVPEVVTPEALREASGAEMEVPPVTEEIELAPAAEAAFEEELGGRQASEVAPEAPSPAAEAPVAPIPWPETELPPEVESTPALAAEAEMVFESPSSVSWNVEAALAGPETEAAAEVAPAPAVDAPTAFAAPPATEADEPVLAPPAPAAEEAPLAPADEVSLVPSPAEAFVAAAVETAPELSGASHDASVPPQDDEPEVEPGAATHAAPAWVSPFATLPDAIERPVAAPIAPAPTAPVVAAAPAADDARWEAMAEEIRMQVLQRIDLFTDTGLREQLGARLQPIVDRASADLVRTINQHVGELLRAYVAEAIEREIERWKSSQ